MPECLAIPADVVYENILEDKPGEAVIVPWSQGLHHKIYRTIQDEGAYFDRKGIDGIDILDNERTDLLQPITYEVFILHDGRIILYERASNENYDEDNLRGFVSMGSGGHMEKRDRGMFNLTSRNEMGKETKVTDADGNDVWIPIVPIGFILDRRKPEDGSTGIGELHLGLLMVRYVPEDVDVEILLGESKNYKAMTVDEIQSLMNDESDAKAQLEPWSALAFEYLTENSLLTDPST